MSEEYTVSRETPRESLRGYQPWFLSVWAQLAILTLGAATTTVVGFAQGWDFALAAGVVILCFAGVSVVFRFYRTQLIRRAEYNVDAFRAAVEARDHVIRQRETRMADLEASLADAKAPHATAASALRDLIRYCAHRAGELHDIYSRLSDEGPDPALLHAAFDLGRDFVGTALARIVAVFEPLVVCPPGRAADLWASLRLLQPTEQGDVVFVTLARAGKFHPGREISSEPIPADHRLIRGVNNEAVVITSPRDPDFILSRNYARYRESQSLMIGAVLMVKDGKKHMPMFVTLNSAVSDLFTDDLRPFMECCTQTVAIALQSLVDRLAIRD